MGEKITQKRYICHNCRYIGGFPISKSRNCPKCGTPYMIPGDTVKGKKLNEEQEIDPLIVTRKSHKHYWIALWIMSIVIALAIAFYLFVVLKPSQNILFTKAKMKLPSEKIDAVDPLSFSIMTFLLAHPEYGDLEKTNEMPDWTSGKRKKVTTSRGEYLFYFEGTEVVSVYKYLPDGGREKIFEHDEITRLD